MTTQHTKLPWVFFVSANNTVISPKWGQFKLAALDSDNHKIDAEFIVRACNAYNLLVEACKVAKQAIDLQLELTDKERERLELDAVALINTALAKAQGETHE